MQEVAYERRFCSQGELSLRKEAPLLPRPSFDAETQAVQVNLDGLGEEQAPSGSLSPDRAALACFFTRASCGGLQKCFTTGQPDKGR